MPVGHACSGHLTGDRAENFASGGSSRAPVADQHEHAPREQPHDGGDDEYVPGPQAHPGRPRPVPYPHALLAVADAGRTVLPGHPRGHRAVAIGEGADRDVRAAGGAQLVDDDDTGPSLASGRRHLRSLRPGDDPQDPSEREDERDVEHESQPPDRAAWGVIAHTGPLASAEQGRSAFHPHRSPNRLHAAKDDVGSDPLSTGQSLPYPPAANGNRCVVPVTCPCRCPGLPGGPSERSRARGAA